jgi:hypothetical protein
MYFKETMPNLCLLSQLACLYTPKVAPGTNFGISEKYVYGAISINVHTSSSPKHSLFGI